MDEQWRDIAGYDGDYQVSNLGRVRSFKYRPDGHILKTCFQKRPSGGFQHVSVGLSHHNVLKWHRLHHLVWEAFVSPIRPYTHIRFKDSNVSNCTLDNLYLQYSRRYYRKDIHGVKREDGV